MTTQPEVGRLVHYVSYGSADGRYESKCRTAFVTETHPDYTTGPRVGLAVLNPTGVFFDRNVRQNESKHTGGSWHWPCLPNNQEKERDGEPEDRGLS